MVEYLLSVFFFVVFHWSSMRVKETNARGGIMQKETQYKRRPNTELDHCERMRAMRKERAMQGKDGYGSRDVKASGKPISIGN